MEQFDLAANVGRNLKKLFADEGKTYADVAELCHCDERTVGRWIQNGIDKLSIISYIADVFGVKAEDIIFSKEK